jgi:hypothetical protein
MPRREDWTREELKRVIWFKFYGAAPSLILREFGGRHTEASIDMAWELMRDVADEIDAGSYYAGWR